jgi:hypothetical protein
MPALRRFHSIAALCGDGLRPELQALFERLAVDPHSELFVRRDGMVQSGPDPVSAQATVMRSAAEHCGADDAFGTASVGNQSLGIRATLKKFADS